jgi:hypothetical protein
VTGRARRLGYDNEELTVVASLGVCVGEMLTGDPDELLCRWRLLLIGAQHD